MLSKDVRKESDKVLLIKFNVNSLQKETQQGRTRRDPPSPEKGCPQKPTVHIIINVEIYEI